MSSLGSGRELNPYVDFKLLSALFTTGAMVSADTLLRLAFGESSQARSDFAPFEALQPMQQSAIFSMVAISTLLMMCSQELTLFLSEPNSTPQ